MQGIEELLLQDAESLKRTGESDIGILLSRSIAIELRLELETLGNVAQVDPKKRSRLAGLHVSIVEQYPSPGYLVGPLVEINRLAAELRSLERRDQ